ncbi:MAG TPA: malto-oligosyltrehalose synthase, partial [Acidimicrobiales bacterium]|nr:malto-oligosyltrehalose synthase [Acidimicrobiales bacterium]
VAPSSTYRVQLNQGFTFMDATAIVGYLSSLGISHLYCSPYLAAVPGSTHGYDVADPHRFNDELGGSAGHAAMAGALRQAGMGQVLDIVPNHMAADAKANPWWWDVLENGPSSPYAHYYDIEWDTGDERSSFTVLVPILADQYGRVLEKGDVTVARTGSTFAVRYFDNELPVSPRTLDEILGRAARASGSAPLGEIAEGVASLPPARVTDRAGVQERHDRKIQLASRLADLCEGDQAVAEAIDAELRELNSDADRLDELLRRQNYRLAFWRVASEEIDYRRFFNIDALIGVRVEDPDVFADTHSLILQLVRDGTLDGLRVDHVDGLKDPAAYLKCLDEASGGVYTVVEKILSINEELPRAWPVAGTSGYDFLINVNNLFVAREHEAEMTEAYHGFTGETASWPDVAHAAKLQVMRQDLAADVERLSTLLAHVCDRHRRNRDHTRPELRDALRELVARYTVYRTYVHPTEEVSDTDRMHVDIAVSETRRNRPDIDAELVVFLGELALGVHEGAAEAEFSQRLQQLTAPVIAKGVEDTAFYRYNRLISLNEVGGEPGVFGSPLGRFHEAMAVVDRDWPATMTTLSTHDTKRSADVRARLNVISEIPSEWTGAVALWADLAASHRRGGWPDANAEYLLYQSLIGAWPLPPDRAAAFMIKAVREAKVLTSWTEINSEYEEAVEGFVRGVLGDYKFVAGVEAFLGANRLIERGRQNSLVQTALLLTCPGVPDLYQGTEIWDLSLVDPDNRRPVDFRIREQLLNEVRSLSVREVVPVADSGAPKIWMVHKLLEHRRRNLDDFGSELYEPLTTGGPGGDSVAAFERGRLAVVAPVRTGTDWTDTTVDLPSGEWRDVLTGDLSGGGTRGVGELLAGFPVAVLTREGA